MGVAAGTKLVYDFPEGSKDMRELLGGKGAGVAEMTRILGPERVPAGFMITTEACVAYMDAGRREPEGLGEQVDEALGRLEEMAGRRLGGPSDPLLVSVRSGAAHARHSRAADGHLAHARGPLPRHAGHGVHLARRRQGPDRLHSGRRGRRRREGRDVVLVRPFTEAADVAGFFNARGILTAEGGKASHAALVARGNGPPLRVGRVEPRDRSDCTRGPGELHGPLRGRQDRDQRHDRRGHDRRRPAVRTGVDRGVPHDPPVGRRAAPPARARQRRHPR